MTDDDRTDDELHADGLMRVLVDGKLEVRHMDSISMGRYGRELNPNHGSNEIVVRVLGSDIPLIFKG